MSVVIGRVERKPSTKVLFRPLSPRLWVDAATFGAEFVNRPPRLLRLFFAEVLAVEMGFQT